MLIATNLTVVVFASALAGAAPVTSSLPPLTITVATSGPISPTLVARALAETEAVWQSAGLTFVWKREAPEARSCIDAGPALVHGLRVVIGSGRTADAVKRSETTTALGWITFDDEGRPDREIYVSYDNAEKYLVSARAVVGLVDRMPLAERETLLGRAMGRALAHEIGHYLLASKLHTPRGLMQATHTAADFFGYARNAFAVGAEQRDVVVKRLSNGHALAARHQID
jgi:hypothetical protein